MLRQSVPKDPGGRRAFESLLFSPADLHWASVFSTGSLLVASHGTAALPLLGQYLELSLDGISSAVCYSHNLFPPPVLLLLACLDSEALFSTPKLSLGCLGPLAFVKLYIALYYIVTSAQSISP